MNKAKDIKLSGYIRGNTTIQRFEYAEVEGWAELIGWQLIVFRKEENGPISVISLEDMTEPVFKDISNRILSDIGLPFKAGMSIASIISYLGQSFETDFIFENHKSYYFDKSDYLIVCSVHDEKGLSGIEIIFDEEVKRNRLEWLNE